MAKETREFEAIDKQVFAIAGLLDAQLRVCLLYTSDAADE